jgi:hypothetical protein
MNELERIAKENFSKYGTTNPDDTYDAITSYTQSGRPTTEYLNVKTLHEQVTKMLNDTMQKRFIKNLSQRNNVTLRGNKIIMRG